MDRWFHSIDSYNLTWLFVWHLVSHMSLRLFVPNRVRQTIVWLRYFINSISLPNNFTYRWIPKFETEKKTLLHILSCWIGWRRHFVDRPGICNTPICGRWQSAECTPSIGLVRLSTKFKIQTLHLDKAATLVGLPFHSERERGEQCILFHTIWYVRSSWLSTTM